MKKHGVKEEIFIIMQMMQMQMTILQRKKNTKLFVYKKKKWNN